MKRNLLVILTLALVAGAGLGSAQAAPSWPTLQKQLEKDHILPGSALERLIRENQDFSVLGEQGGRDQINVPLWLKVYWRKHHPEARYSLADPTGGYPLILEELYEWMLVHQDLKPGPAGVEQGLRKVLSESGEQRISGAQFNPRSESDIRVNYWNTSRIIGASNNISGAQAQFYSANGGVSWGQTFLPLLGGDVRHGDPAVDWMSDGSAWSATIGIDSSSSILRMRAYKSFDGGASWSFDATFSGSQSNADKEMIWVDHGNSSVYRNNLYATWHNNNPVYFSRRTGPAGSWSSPIQISGSETTGTGIGGDVKSNTFGDVFVFWPDTGSRGIYTTKSTNGGVSFGSRVRIATTFGSFKLGVPADNIRKPFIYVTAAAFRNPDKNRVFAAWMDLTGATGCTSTSNAPGSNTASSCKTRIWFASSFDGGATWSARKMINNQASLNDQFNPWIVADDTTGALSIMYYDTVADAGRKKTHVYYQSSFDDGQTWNPPFRVTTVQTDETVAGADTGNQYGDYNSLSGYAANFFPSWTDRRSGAREEIWTAAMSDPVPHGNPFVFDSVADMYQSCLGIASRNSSYCGSVVNADDRNMCSGLAQGLQAPCTNMVDRNLQLACYGMSVKPNFPSNCRDITDANMRNFCYGASGVSLTDIDICRSITWRDTQLFCFAMNDNISSNCRDISISNDRNYCYAVSAHDPSSCNLIH